MRKVVFCVALALSLACASCSKNNIHPVSGRVTYNGFPAAGAAVVFVRQGSAPSSEPAVLGVVQEDGSFELVCGSLGKGAPPGEYDVLIEWKRVLGPGHAERGGPDRLRGRFADPKQPRFHAVIDAKTKVLPTFELADP